MVFDIIGVGVFNIIGVGVFNIVFSGVFNIIGSGVFDVIDSGSAGNGSGAFEKTVMFSDVGITILQLTWLQIWKMMEKLVGWGLRWRASRRLKR